VVIDRETGQTPLSAAERMDIYDRSMGVEPVRPAKTPAKPGAAPGTSAAAGAESGLSVRATPTQQAGTPAASGGQGRMATAIAERGKRPWKAAPNDRPALEAKPAPARIPARAAPPTGGARKTIVTGKWWDAKGPRTIELGSKGQQVLSSSFLTLFFVALVAAIAALFFEPILLFIGGFLLFRFGGHILGPIGASIIDKAIAEKG